MQAGMSVRLRRAWLLLAWLSVGGCAALGAADEDTRARAKSSYFQLRRPELGAYVLGDETRPWARDVALRVRNHTTYIHLDGSGARPCSGGNSRGQAAASPEAAPESRLLLTRMLHDLRERGLRSFVLLLPKREQALGEQVKARFLAHCASSSLREGLEVHVLSLEDDATLREAESVLEARRIDRASEARSQGWAPDFAQLSSSEEAPAFLPACEPLTLAAPGFAKLPALPDVLDHERDFFLAPTEYNAEELKTLFDDVGVPKGGLWIGVGNESNLMRAAMIEASQVLVLDRGEDIVRFFNLNRLLLAAADSIEAYRSLRGIESAVGGDAWRERLAEWAFHPEVLRDEMRRWLHATWGIWRATQPEIGARPDEANHSALRWDYMHRLPRAQRGPDAEDWARSFGPWNYVWEQESFSWLQEASRKGALHAYRLDLFDSEEVAALVDAVFKRAPGSELSLRVIDLSTLSGTHLDNRSITDDRSFLRLLGAFDTLVPDEHSYALFVLHRKAAGYLRDHFLFQLLSLLDLNDKQAQLDCIWSMRQLLRSWPAIVERDIPRLREGAKGAAWSCERAPEVDPTRIERDILNNRRTLDDNTNRVRLVNPSWTKESLSRLQHEFLRRSFFGS